MATIAIITARGGSKRIPKKNIRPFCGKPILAYSIEAALQSGMFDEVMVSTDSEEIAAVARQYGASVPFLRSAATSDDFATTRDVLMEVLEKYRAQGRRFDYMVCLYPTAPFVTAEKLRQALALLQREKGKMLVPVVRFSFPPQRAYVIRDGALVYRWEAYRSSRSQDLEPFYHDAGQFYCYDVAAYLAENGNIQDDVLPLVLPEEQVQDIDTLSDWKMAELKYQVLTEKGDTNEI